MTIAGWRLYRLGLFLMLLILAVLGEAQSTAGGAEDAKIALGRALFTDMSLSHDLRTKCQTCHDPKHAYADAHPRAIGTDHRVGTRNAPSLIGIGNETIFFWDGRRTRLEEAVLDPFTNPVELGLPSFDVVLDRLRRNPAMLANFQRAFPNEEAPSKDQIGIALARFVRSLDSRDVPRDLAQQVPSPPAPMVDQGKKLFEGIAGCTECHTVTGQPVPFSDGSFHHSGIGRIAERPQLPELVQQVVRENLDVNALGPKVLGDEQWSTLGRFVVTLKPSDIGAFRTPSLRNVALTAPYMHDGSIATLAEAVDREIYYHSFSRGRPINLSQIERQAIVAFLESLTDVPRVSGNGISLDVNHHNR